MTFRFSPCVFLISNNKEFHHLLDHAYMWLITGNCSTVRAEQIQNIKIQVQNVQRKRGSCESDTFLSVIFEEYLVSM